MFIKIRKIGNSLGGTLPRRAMKIAGFQEKDTLLVEASLGRITISVPDVVVRFTVDEAKAVIAGELDSPSAQSAIRKIATNLNISPEDHDE